MCLYEDIMSNGSFIAENGVLQIYSNNPRLPIWVMGFGNWNSRAPGSGASGSGAATVLQKSGQVRYGVKCTPSANDNTEQNHKINLARGYSDTENDFVSIEQTGFVEITHQASNEKDQDVTWYGPSGRHTGNMDDDHSDKKGCMGTCYKGSLHSGTGKNRMGKENWHVNYTYEGVNWKEGPGSIDNLVKQMARSGKRVGFKWVNMKIGNKRRLEIWVDSGGAIGYSPTDKPVNKWQLVRVYEDNSDWGEDQDGLDLCGCDNKKQVILWGAPECTYRWDNQTAKLSLDTIQEITPPTEFHVVGDIVSPNP
jgi:hypothetical protein